MVPWFMAKTSVVPKKKRGPPPTGKGIQVGERWHPSELAAIDAWIASSRDKTLSRAHAIRRLVALGLRVKSESRGKSEDTKGAEIPSNALANLRSMRSARSPIRQPPQRPKRAASGGSSKGLRNSRTYDATGQTENNRVRTVEVT